MGKHKNKSEEAVAKSAHRGKKLKEWDDDCMLAACEQYHLQENNKYPIDLDQMTLRTISKVYLNGKSMTTFRNKATVHKIGQRHSIDDTEIDNAEELEGFLIAHGHSKLLKDKHAEGIVKSGQPFKLARKLTEIAKKKGYVKKRVVDTTQLDEIRLPPLDATSSDSEGEFIPPPKKRKSEEKPNHDQVQQQNGQNGEEMKHVSDEGQTQNNNNGIENNAEDNLEKKAQEDEMKQVTDESPTETNNEPEKLEKKTEDKVETKVQVKDETVESVIKTERKTKVKHEEKLENKVDLQVQHEEKKEDDNDTLPDLGMQLKIQDVRTLQPQQEEMNHEQKNGEEQVEALDLVVKSKGVKRKRKPPQSLPVDLSKSHNSDKVDLVYRRHKETFAPKKTLNLQSPVFLNPVVGKNVVDVSAMAHNITLSWIQGHNKTSDVNELKTLINSYAAKASQIQAEKREAQRRHSVQLAAAQRIRVSLPSVNTSKRKAETEWTPEKLEQKRQEMANVLKIKKEACAKLDEIERQRHVEEYGSLMNYHGYTELEDVMETSDCEVIDEVTSDDGQKIGSTTPMQDYFELTGEEELTGTREQLARIMARMDVPRS